jgi:ABC-type amino acid transport substrate-binding protein
MKIAKKIISIVLAVALIACCFAGCSSNTTETYSDEVLIIGYTDTTEPFLQVDENGKATGFEPDLMQAIFKDIKGDYTSFVFEKVDEGYQLDEDGGFFDSEGTEYSASLLMGAVSKNNGTFNEDYSFTEPVISNRIIALVANGSKIKSYSDFDNAKAVVVSQCAQTAFESQSTIYNACKSVKTVDSIDDALAMLNNGKADVVVTDEFDYMPSADDSAYTTLSGELDTIEYVIACAKYGSWKDSINEAIRELQSKDYGDGDEFTEPLVEKYFGYNASSFTYETEGDK